MLISSLFAILLIGLAAPATAQKSLRAWVYGNSLVHHLTDSDETTVPHWLALLAEAGGHDFALSGKWGFLQDFARDLPPEPNWSFAQVPQAWTPDNLAFRRIGFDTVLITPPNFIQYQSAAEPYGWDNPDNATPLSDTLRVIDWTSHQARGARFWIYEGWAEMSGIVDFPPDAEGLLAYHAANQGSYHDWYLDYVAAIAAERPEIEIGLIPVASTLGAVLNAAPLRDLPGEALYSDDAPHGTANIYFLAALVTYATLLAEAPPLDMALPDSIDPLIRDNYADVAAQIWLASTGAVLPDAARSEAATEAAAARPAFSLPPDTGLTDPSLAMGLNGIADWSTQQPFLDLMKTARPWIGHLPGQWGGWDMGQMVAAGHIGPDGWPLSLPPDVEAIEAFILTDQPAAATSLAGRYVMLWDGQGEMSVTGIARDIAVEDGRISFGYRPGEGLVAVRIEALDAADPIRNIRIVREDRLPLLQAGAIFNPDWLARIADLRAVRFMDWMLTNGSPQVTWGDRPRPDDFSYVWRGVPVEVMVALANQIGADPWFTLPHMADDAYVATFAGVVRDTLDPRLHVYAEWSNEVWNFIFPQAIWANEQARARWGQDAADDVWMQFAGLRAAEVADIWSEVFADDPDRLVRVVATHTGWLGLEEALLEAPLAVAEGALRPADSFDAYAVAGYFGFEIGSDERMGEVQGWIAEGNAPARITADLRDGSFAELKQVIFPHHAGVAAAHDMALIMYEGGTHIAGHGQQAQDPAIVALYADYNYSADMAALYADLITAWRAEGGQLFNAFVDVAAPTQYGSWGALRHLDDNNPRWATLQAFNAMPTGLPRTEGAFVHGLHLLGTEAGEEIAGTPEEDVVLAGGGDDILRPGGGADILHGQAGVDRAILPGAATDYAQGWDGETLLLIAPDGALSRLTSIEELVFESEPEVVQSLTEPEAAE